MLTPRIDLRSGDPVWAAKRAPATHHAALSANVETEVLVVGAGISGAMVAEALTDEGLDVVVVDRRRPLAGSTSASTALLQYEIDTPLSTLARSLGRARAEAVWRRSRLAVDALVQRAKYLEIEADMAPRDALYLSGSSLDAKGLAVEADARRRIGLQVELLHAKQIHERYGIRRSAALLGFGDFVADPRKLAAGFLRVAHERGAAIYSPVDILSVRETPGRVVASTRGGPTIRSRFVVFATGYEIAKGVPRKGHAVQSTWAIATRPQPSRLWPTECMIWEAAEPYMYVRTTPEGRVICGGEDEPFQDEARRDAASPAKWRALSRKLVNMFPALDSAPRFQWAGSFGASDKGTPLIGRVPRMKRGFAVLGCGGNGITFSMLAAQILRGLISGRGDPDAALFALGRTTR